MPQSLLTGQLKEKPTYRVWCLYSSFVHGYMKKNYKRGKPMRIWIKNTAVFLVNLRICDLQVNHYKFVKFAICDMRTGTLQKFADLRLLNEPKNLRTNKKKFACPLLNECWTLWKHSRIVLVVSHWYELLLYLKKQTLNFPSIQGFAWVTADGSWVRGDIGKVDPPPPSIL